jgi:hypothetical protein
MAVERSSRRSTGKRVPGRDGTTESGTTRSTPGTRYVDFDPWAMLAELMETPEEEPTEGPRPKGK